MKNDVNVSMVLVVDNQPNNVVLLQNVIEDAGFSVKVTYNGVQALIAAENFQPDLILLDIMMPEMDGIEVCRRLKSNIKTKDIPVVFISALDDKDNIITALGVGGIDYITKPFNTKDVLFKISKYIKTHKRKKILEKQQYHMGKLKEHITELKSKKK